MLPGPDYRRVVVENCRPTADNGRFSAKASLGVAVELSADIYCDGHDGVVAWARYGPLLPPARAKSKKREGGIEVTLLPAGDDRFAAWVVPDAVGPFAFEIMAVVDDYGSWLASTQIKHREGSASEAELDVELNTAANLVRARLRPTLKNAADRAALPRLAAALEASGDIAARLEVAGETATRELLRRTIDRSEATVAGPFPIRVDGPLGGCSAWYEMFPRSEGAVGGRSGTWAAAEERLPAVAGMGFDIVYLPPIHPIGTAFRKGANNAPSAGAGEPGSPWAIGAASGGHTAVHPDLGSDADFDHFVAAARQCGLAVALDIAFQCSPDHPWVKEHPDWFQHRADGTIRYAENPPKKYQDTYPFDFASADRAALYEALRDVVLFWCGRGIDVFRVDNPHTKPLPFWEWLISSVQERHPQAVFLAEAFTRPKVMYRLAKAGFTQSYTYFTWRTGKAELSDYLMELNRSEVVDWFRPNFWTNTPDILHTSLQEGGPAAFRLRLLLAALGAPCWGMYSGYELCENVAVEAGSEEYLDSEKYQYRPRDWQHTDSLAPLVASVNGIRLRHRMAVAQPRTLQLHPTDNEQILCFSRSAHDGSDAIVVVVNLDPHRVQEATLQLDLGALQISREKPYTAYDELNGATYAWHGSANYIRLDPSQTPGHVFRLSH